MKVLVTGGSGFVGSHAVAALTRNGHDVRVLARSDTKTRDVLANHGVEAEIIVGDMTDPESITRAIEGCDAVIHAAAAVGFAGDFASAAHTNLVGATNVLTAAAAAGCDPIIYTGSLTVHLPTDAAVVGPSSPLATPMSDYGASKRDIEHMVRDLVGEGAPITTFVLGGVYGPVSPHLDNSFVAVLSALGGSMVTPPGGTSIIDVRDVAELLTNALEPGQGARRFVAGGHFLTWPEWVAALSAAAGTEIPVMDVTADDMVALGIECDALRAAGEDALPLSEEAAMIMCSVVRTDDSATLRQLGTSYRPVHDTLTDTVNYLRTTGQLGATA